MSLIDNTICERFIDCVRRQYFDRPLVFGERHRFRLTNAYSGYDIFSNLIKM